MANPKIFFNILIGKVKAGRGVMEFLAVVTRKIVEHSFTLHWGERYGSSAKYLRYKGSSFHQIIPGFMCQGEDFTRGKRKAVNLSTDRSLQMRTLNLSTLTWYVNGRCRKRFQCVAILYLYGEDRMA